MKQLNQCVFDAEEVSKMQQIIDQASFVTQGMGEILSEEPSHVRHLLELGCGPGEWALALAQQYPHIHVTGIDIDEKLIAYAQLRAEEAQLQNTTFRRLSAFQLPSASDFPTLSTFPDASFDFISGRFFGTFISRNLWCEVIQQCYRLLQAGGTLQFTEHALASTNSPACDEWLDLIYMAQLKRGQKKSKSESATIMLSSLLEEGRFESIKLKAYAIDFSFGRATHNTMSTVLLNEIEAHRSFMIEKMNLVTAEHYEDLKERVFAEFRSLEFKGIWFLCTVKGRKPQ